MITERNIEVLREIDTFKSKHGYPPTADNIRRVMMLASTNAIRKHLEVLRNAGLLVDVPASETYGIRPARGNVLTEAGKNKLHPHSEPTLPLSKFTSHD